MIEMVFFFGPVVTLLVATTAISASSSQQLPAESSSQTIPLHEGLGGNLGDSLWKTFLHTKELPLTAETAESSGYKKISDCNPNLGILYAQGDAATEDHPLAIYFTAKGQVAGLRATTWGTNKEIGPAAPDNLIVRGYWKLNADNTSWSIDISFRAPAVMCNSQDISQLLLGDRLVINQESIARALPLTTKDAVAQKYYRGSCMMNMGTHYFYDLKYAPESSWEEEWLMPIVPMYHPDTGNIHAFFFTTPVAQHGSKDLLFASHDWEAPALSPKNMCQNWCDEKCTWKTSAWSTMHIYLSRAWKELKCPNGSGILNRSCDL